MENIDTNQIFKLRKQASILEASFKLKNSIKDFWPYVANNDSVSGKGGKPPSIFSFIHSETGLTFLKGQFKFMGMAQKYIELPYEWNEPFFMIGEVIYETGPLKYCVVGIELKDNGNLPATFHLKISYVPRIPFLGKSMAKDFYKKIIKIYQEIDQKISPNDISPIKVFFEINDINIEKAKKLKDKWNYLMPESKTPEKLAEYIFTAPDKYISKIRPFEVAKFMELDKLEVLKFCLLATKEGFLDLSWDIICPSCKGTSFSTVQLMNLMTESHCDSCGIGFNASFDQNIEVTFKPHNTLREINYLRYCLGSPDNTPHISSQITITPKSSREIELFFYPGKYRLRCSTLDEEIYFDIVKSIEKKELSLDLQKNFSAVNNLELAEKTTFTFNNPEEQWQTIKIYNLAYHELAATAHFVTTLQDFRDSFSSEVLRPGVKMGISNLVILFSDLKDSTMLYDTKGDALAFSLVQDHFDILIKIIRENNGGIVKTIGDAVMAVFTGSSEAVKAAIEILEDFNRWNEGHQIDQKIIVSLGLHKGPCIALNLNDRLDYFGSTVNKAARIQGTSKEGNLIISDYIFNESGVQNVIDQFNNIKISSFEAQLKGISGKNTLYRIEI